MNGPRFLAFDSPSLSIACRCDVDTSTDALCCPDVHPFGQSSERDAPCRTKNVRLHQSLSRVVPLTPLVPIHLGALSDEKALAAAKLEATMLAGLHHPNVVQCHGRAVPDCILNPRP